MKRMHAGNWRAAAVAALMVPVAVLAREPVSSPDDGSGAGNVPRQEGLDRNFNNFGVTMSIDRSNSGSQRLLEVGPQANGVGMPIREVTPDQDEVKRLSGKVLKLNGQMLYLETEPGAVVPLDLSALRIRKQPEKGQHVVAVYQVENTTENVALALAGEVQPKD
ncbi:MULTISPECIES: hypothetical protein [Myxococcus]|uniref:Lipoprotein n=1 Tax=Myxococcus xanthus TaxID=34 RepID=A0AAE6FV41_MYXXA|nr:MULTISPECIES: hypothetical protein [Myxococcus]NOK07020.1 hypothetical protein [Myxococcus xanthus]QDE65551.1 hypothetical protein BHS09_00185 [Myxococcus xanthus]QDE72824.1 hypothetical protein BHS08_00185 [Myxococcus xanthus]QDE80102.1 hypothetical protein BHS07_00185 [Myxococcus xanthus]QDE94414.1 hypothetical protein BHS05_00180 [Myxococcus xanthus]